MYGRTNTTYACHLISDITGRIGKLQHLKESHWIAVIKMYILLYETVAMILELRLSN